MPNGPKTFVAAEGHAVGIVRRAFRCKHIQKPDAKRMEEKQKAEKRQRQAAARAMKRLAEARERFVYHQKKCQKSH